MMKKLIIIIALCAVAACETETVTQPLSHRAEVSHTTVTAGVATIPAVTHCERWAYASCVSRLTCGGVSDAHTMRHCQANPPEPQLDLPISYEDMVEECCAANGCDLGGTIVRADSAACELETWETQCGSAPPDCI